MKDTIMHPVFNDKVRKKCKARLKEIRNSKYLEEIKNRVESFDELSEDELKRDVENAKLFTLNMLENISFNKQ